MSSLRKLIAPDMEALDDRLSVMATRCERSRSVMGARYGILKDEITGLATSPPALLGTTIAGYVLGSRRSDAAETRELAREIDKLNDTLENAKWQTESSGRSTTNGSGFGDLLTVVLRSAYFFTALVTMLEGEGDDPGQCS